MAIARECPGDNRIEVRELGGVRVSESRELVEHFFRQESGRLVAVLARSLGVRQLELAEVVQVAFVQALEAWSRRGGDSL